MPSLSVLAQPGLEFCYTLERDVVTVGRGPDCEVVIRDARASRRHLELRRDGRRWVARDLASRNGTRLNGVALAHPTPLREGDEIEIGSLRLRFHELGNRGPATGEATTNVSAQHPATALAGTAILVGCSPAMVRLREVVARVAPQAVSVLVLGESGTGKELVARLLHRLSARAEKPYEIVNCPALPAALIEAELFGVERGAATGVEARAGRLERAEGGTLFLDEVGDLDLAAQAKLLRFLQDHVVERIGGRRRLGLDVRVVAATNRDLEEAVRSGAFRRDLYHRLNVVSIELPPLRERREDLPLLSEHFLARHPEDHKRLSAEALAILAGYDWPGNVRELEHVIESARLFAEEPLIAPRHLPKTLLGGVSESRAPVVGPGGDTLYRRLVEEGQSFWLEVRDPLVARRLDRGAVRALFLRVYREANGSHRNAAVILGVGDEYKRFLDFVRYHRLRVRDLLVED